MEETLRHRRGGTELGGDTADRGVMEGEVGKEKEAATVEAVAATGDRGEDATAAANGAESLYGRCISAVQVEGGASENGSSTGRPPTGPVAAQRGAAASAERTELSCTYSQLPLWWISVRVRPDEAILCRGSGE